VENKGKKRRIAAPAVARLSLLSRKTRCEKEKKKKGKGMLDLCRLHSISVTEWKKKMATSRTSVLPPPTRQETGGEERDRLDCSSLLKLFYQSGFGL